MFQWFQYCRKPTSAALWPLQLLRKKKKKVGDNLFVIRG